MPDPEEQEPEQKARKPRRSRRLSAVEAEFVDLPRRHRTVRVFDALAGVANLTTDDLDMSVVRRMAKKDEARPRRHRAIANPPADEEE